MTRGHRDVIEDLVDDIAGDNIEEVLAVDEVSERASHEIEVRSGAS